ncbi:co-chaperone YbbN [Thalassotalea insulae]|uniref:Co-chaperone YbbN n=1 Tax=Thalassotalea insulae TaxID=2056778 RepID=A0ABQ6GTB3_9GAMM|nr:tetratricopeptide repeat protein [Thalassotalea insulae]GLX77695.1 co-chaperone YbbN [Thalassotalea insulae]
MSTNSIAMTLDNFQQIVLEQSKEKLVLVSFWAEQVPESVELKDKLTTKVADADEYLLHATVDCQAQAQIAQQFGIQGLPTAVLVKDGQPIDGLSGPQTEESITQFLDKHLPKQEDLLLAQARQQVSEGDVNQAFAVISQAHQLAPERADIKLLLADVFISTGKTAEAEQLLDSIKMVDQDSEYKAVMAKLELATQAADSPEIQALEAQLQSSPDDIDLQRKLAAQYSQVNRNEEALSLLFSMVQKDAGDQKSKELLLDVLKALPDGDPLASKFRRKLYTLMY